MMRTAILRLLPAVLACGLLTACGGKAEKDDPASVPTSAPEIAVEMTPVEKAGALIAEMVEVYRAAPIQIDTITTTSTIGGQVRPATEVTLRLGPGTDLEYTTPFYSLVHFDRSLYVSYTDVPDRYLRIDDVDDAMAKVKETLGEGTARLVAWNLRLGRPQDEIVQAFGLGLSGNVRISGYREIVDNDGKKLRQISLISPGGSATINVDPGTKWVHSIETEEKLEDVPIPNLSVRRSMKYATATPTTAPPVTFVPGDRFATDSTDILRGVGGPDALRKLKLVPGENAPDFSLHTVLGERFVLSQRRGPIMALVFWANWDTTSREAMRKLTAITPWARENKIDVEVIGICGMARSIAEEAYWEKTVEFWEREELPFQTLIDRKEAVFERYGVLGVPMIVVLDQEGRFVNAIGGFEEGSLEAVARIVEGAAQAAEKR